MKDISIRSIGGVFWGGVQFVLNIIQSIILVPYILKFWDKEKYGIWLGVYAFITLMRTFDLGHQTYISNEYSKYFYLDKEKAKFLLGSSIKISFLIGLMELAIFTIFVIFNLQSKVIGTPITLDITIGVFSMLIMWFLTGSIGGILVKIILPLGFYNRTIIWGIFNKLLELFVLIVGIWFNFSVGQLLIFLALMTTLYSITLFYDIKMLSPEIYPWWQKGTLRAGLKNFRISLGLTLNGFLDQIANTSIISFIGNFLQTATIPAFTTMKTLTNVMTQANQILLSPLQADIVKFHVQNEKSKLNAIFYLNWLIAIICFVLPIMIIFPFIGSLYEWWTVKKIPFNQPLAVALFSGVIISGFGKAFMFYLSSTNNIRSIFINNITRVVLILPLSFFLLKEYQSLTVLAWVLTIGELICGLLIPLYFVSLTFNDIFEKKTLSLMILIIFQSILFLIGYTYLFSTNKIFFWINILIAIILVLLFFKQMPKEIQVKINEMKLKLNRIRTNA